ncbi:phage major capsid protein [Acetobacter oeni]|uniref:Phage capsid protein n=1 Tax=Acetobacter oeni TaxID=304077 RepID=A0A511XP42_9PROT|nr:phage major capsid protein [Acetobacter oeni]MBB3884482.1 HK97 family phage major capsid protein [Acetobacter oeni]NHO20414.1 phage major capsid protein [Acetobacter oeni]GBR00519.1 HK97 family phage major capsid protein [Acetobacter oeni LMG 21952]GEN64707.1 phage capsid protein [Acetobacter oeni]
MSKLHELRRKKATLAAEMKTIATKAADLPEGEELSKEDESRFSELETDINALGKVMDLMERAQEAEGDAAEAVDDGEKDGDDDDTDGDDADADDDGIEEEKALRRMRRKSGASVAAQAAKKLDKGAVVGAMIRMIANGNGSRADTLAASKSLYGERSPITKALSTGTGAAGGFIVPPDYVAQVIEYLYPLTVVRSSGPRVLPMPRGTMTLPRQSQTATAGYGAELAAIPTSEQRLDNIVASYKKLTALVPVSNDLMRYSDPAIDAFVRDDLVQIIARREDLAFIRGDGLNDSPRGFKSFCPATNVITAGTTAGVTDLATILQTVNQGLTGAITKLRMANVPVISPVWIMNPRTEMFLYSLLNALGVYVYRDEMNEGKILGIPYKTTTQIPVNLTSGNVTDLSEIYLVEMTQALLLDSMSMELSVSREASYTDQTGNVVSTFQQDQTLVRCIAEHDFQMRHDEAIAMIQAVDWQPTLS